MIFVASLVNVNSVIYTSGYRYQLTYNSGIGYRKWLITFGDSVGTPGFMGGDVFPGIGRLPTNSVVARITRLGETPQLNSPAGLSGLILWEKWIHISVTTGHILTSKILPIPSHPFRSHLFVLHLLPFLKNTAAFAAFPNFAVEKKILLALRSFT